MKKFPYSLQELEQTIKYTYKNNSIISTALTHSSYSNEMKAHGKQVECNERLEFLGDSVLSIIVSEYLFIRFSDHPEGDLTRMRAALVCEKSLAQFAETIHLGYYLKLGHGEEMNKGRERKSILADAFEALLASIFLDSEEKGFETAKQFLLPFIKDSLKNESDNKANADFKTVLQQIVQQADGEILEYVLTAETGPDHMKSFEIEARLNSNVIGKGTGKTKREAEQKAAKQALELFGEK